MYIATGFNKWGMTSSNVAANIIVDKILGRENEYEEVFKATRLHPIKNNAELGNMIKETANSLVINKFKVPEVVTDEDLGDVGLADEDRNGKIYTVKPICTHLGCLLSWNNLDKTWDCPCHGSRFNYMGHQLYTPAIRDLDVLEVEEPE